MKQSSFKDVPNLIWAEIPPEEKTVHNTGVNALYQHCKNFDGVFFSEKIVANPNDLQKIEFRLLTLAIVIENLIHEHWLFTTYSSRKVLSLIKNEMEQYRIDEKAKLHFDEYAFNTVDYYRKCLSDWNSLRPTENSNNEDRMLYAIKIAAVYERIFVNPLSAYFGNQETLNSKTGDRDKVNYFISVFHGINLKTKEVLNKLDDAFSMSEAFLKWNHFKPVSQLDDELAKAHKLAERKKGAPDIVEGWLLMNYDIIQSPKSNEIDFENLQFTPTSSALPKYKTDGNKSFEEIITFLGKEFSYSREDAAEFLKIAVKDLMQ